MSQAKTPMRQRKEQLKGNRYANILRENRKRYNMIRFGCTLDSPGKLKKSNAGSTLDQFNYILWG